MRLITAVIKPFKLDEVKDALKSNGITGMTATEVRGFVARAAIPRPTEVPSTRSTLFQVRLELVVEESQVDLVVDTIANVASTEKIGDGKIWVTAIERTCESEPVKRTFCDLKIRRCQMRRCSPHRLRCTYEHDREARRSKPLDRLKELKAEVIDTGLCTGCSGCVVTRPHDVIGYEHEEGKYLPFHLESELGPDNCVHGEKGCTTCIERARASA